MMELDWDAEPLSDLGIPLPLQRKCEQLGYWAADDLVEAINRSRFPWVALEYDERMQLERAVHRWSVAIAAERGARKSSRGLLHRRKRTQSRG
jgi:hypothetical protein